MDNSPLARLPAELRNEISELALYHGDIGFRRASPYGRTTFFCLHRDPECPAFKKCRCRHHLALAQTCKQPRHETLRLFFDINTFELGISDDTGIHRWTRRLLLKDFPPTMKENMVNFKLDINEDIHNKTPKCRDLRNVISELRGPSEIRIRMMFNHCRVSVDRREVVEKKLEIDGGDVRGSLERALADREKLPKNSGGSH